MKTTETRSGPGGEGEKPRARTLVIALVTLASLAGADIISVESEIRIGREAAGEVERFLPISRDPVLRSRVERIGRRLALVCGRPELPFEFHVVDAREVNAFALPGGFTYVYRGLLQAVPSDDAVAFILGHEIAHAVRRHAVKQLRKNTLVDLVSLPLRRFMGDAGREWLRLILQQTYSRDDESEADRMGLEMSVSAGFGPDGGPQAMETLLKMYGKDGPSVLILLQDHPGTEHRLKKLRAHAEQLKAARATGLRKDEETLIPGRAPTATLPFFTDSLPPLPQTSSNGPRAADYWPLAPGAQWTYRLVDENGARSALVMRVIERVPVGEDCAYRVETRLGRGVTTSLCVAPAAAELLACRAGRWETEWRFAGDARFAVREEVVSVPQGTHSALRIERLGADGKAACVAWFVKGLGPVKRVSSMTGISELLEEAELKPRAPSP